ncbi:MAG: citrate/2-methylcitrate synthase, partial [Candidatus Eisenbacteria bacterium]
MNQTSTPRTAGSAARLEFDGQSIELPVIVGSEGEVGLDIQKLRAATGAITLDPGFGNTGACQSAITFIDGENGILRYRGYPIQQLAESATFLEVAWLLLEGELPTSAQLDTFAGDVRLHTMLHE